MCIITKLVCAIHSTLVPEKQFHYTSAFTAQKMKFSIKDFFSKCDQIGSLPRIW